MSAAEKYADGFAGDEETTGSVLAAAPDAVEIRRNGGLAALVGVELGEERGEALVSQAEPHFAQLRELDAVAVPTTEPAAAFRLDDRVSRDRD